MRSSTRARPTLRDACRLAAALTIAACSRTASQDSAASGSPTVADQTPAEDPAMPETWSPVVDGLQIRAVPPSRPAAPGSDVTITLHFRNTGSELRRIYLVHSEPFRAMQSTFYLTLPEPTGLGMQPEPRPHGIVITEADFHEIPAGQTRSFTQTLHIPSDFAAGTHSVRWQYANRIERWEGGVQTLDGPTQQLFGGERIPGIWLGELETRFDVVVGR